MTDLAARPAGSSIWADLVKPDAREADLQMFYFDFLKGGLLGDIT
ncbi:hypothetical protein DSM104299_00976 [Baekduia alba]|nr:hypothetical protein [Baekduia alba]WCB92286.1 hypothetical protein DSM104299_00976 [Baekduia alba]